MTKSELVTHVARRLPSVTLKDAEIILDTIFNSMAWQAWTYVPLCFIATAAPGPELDGKIQVLRSFRDMYLMNNSPGKAFLSAYYKYSPPIAKYIAQRSWLRSLVRILLLPVVGVVSLVV
jgi:hypothetical protein